LRNEWLARRANFLASSSMSCSNKRRIQALYM
jgi:hypothetical protein